MDKKQTIGKGKPGPGRKAGGANKIGQELQSMLKASLSRVGGIEYLVRQAEENPTAYMTMISKLLPKQVEMKADVTHNIDPVSELLSGLSRTHEPPSER